MQVVEFKILFFGQDVAMGESSWWGSAFEVAQLLKASVEEQIVCSGDAVGESYHGFVAQGLHGDELHNELRGAAGRDPGASAQDY